MITIEILKYKKKMSCKNKMYYEKDDVSGLLLQ